MMRTSQSEFLCQLSHRGSAAAGMPRERLDVPDGVVPVFGAVIRGHQQSMKIICAGTATSKQRTALAPEIKILPLASAVGVSRREANNNGR